MWRSKRLVDEIAEPEELLEAPWRRPRNWRRCRLRPSPDQAADPRAGRRALCRHGEATEAAVTDLWCADDTLARLRAYVAQHLTR